MKGQCWDCRNLNVKKKLGDTYWTYTCSKYPKYIMDPENFVNFMDCCDKKKGNRIEVHEGVDINKVINDWLESTTDEVREAYHNM